MKVFLLILKIIAYAIFVLLDLGMIFASNERWWSEVMAITPINIAMIFIVYRCIFK